MIDKIKRLKGWWLATIIVFGAIAVIAPQQIGVLLYKILQVTLGIIISYLADKALFKHVPAVDEVDHGVFGASRIIARALIAIGVLYALSVGL